MGDCLGIWEGEWGVIVSTCGVSFWADENFHLLVVMMAAQL